MFSLERVFQAGINVATKNNEKHVAQRIRYASESYYADDYAEPGYSLKEGQQGILFGNWNDEYGENKTDTMRRLCSILERMGFELEWEDEWTCCSGCNKAMRTSPDCYQWLKCWVEYNGDCLCPECFKDIEEDYVEEELVDNPRLAVLPQQKIDLAKYGFIKQEDEFENGFHHGQDDDPKEIFERIKEEHKDTDVVFEVDGKGQFDISFSVWLRPTKVQANDN